MAKTGAVVICTLTPSSWCHKLASPDKQQNASIMLDFSNFFVFFSRVWLCRGDRELLEDYFS